MDIISFRHLEAVLWIARLGTFTAAAERLGTTQPSISARVRELEHRLGIKLFQKEGRTMVLTVKGRDVVRRCEALWPLLEDLIPNPNALSGTVRIGAGEMASATILPPYLARLQAELPLVTIEAEIALTATLLEDLLRSALDIIFLPGPVGGPNLQVETLGSSGLIWVAAPDQAARLGNDFRVSDVPIWSLPPHSPIYAIMMRDLPERAKSGRIIHHCNNVKMLVETVACGGGITLVPDFFVEPAIAEGRLVPLAGSKALPQLPLSVAVRANENDPAVLRVFEMARQVHL